MIYDVLLVKEKQQSRDAFVVFGYVIFNYHALNIQIYNVN